MSRPPSIEPDTQDWTRVLDRPCHECGWAVDDVAFPEIGEAIRANAAAWVAALRAPGATTRRRPDRWSVVEYAAHVRDVHRLFAERVDLMLRHDDPPFDNWDQDATAVSQRYDLEDPAAVGSDLRTAADRVAARYEAVPPEAEGRTGTRSNGSRFTVDSLARYHLHDVVHHLWDVRTAVTLGAYDAAATAYREATLRLPDHVRTAIDDLARRLPAEARVLEIGSGSGRDADVLETAGLRVRRTDVTPGFVDLLRAEGHSADVLDPLADDLGDPAHPGAPYDAVWAGACLLHVLRSDLPRVLARLAGAVGSDGWLWLSLKEGDGEAWSTHGSVGLPRRFVYWREQPLRAALEQSGWRVEHVARTHGLRAERWLGVLARRGIVSSEEAR